ncbi:MAG TPA: hypothetical protein VGH81_12250 [Rudaea sp.]|jgi:hypothetical protein
MATTRRKLNTPRTPSTQIVAGKSRDAQFIALLRRKCLRAASVGALTAAGEAIPGLSRVLGFVFGELLDARFLARIQRELIEETLDLYDVDLPQPVLDALVGKVQLLGTSASVASDAVVRQVLRQSIGRIGGVVALRVLPLVSIASSAFSNAMVTYAVGKRAQAVARLHGEPITALPDALRAFSGLDERRVLEWTVEATKSSLAQIGSTLRRVTLHRGKARAKPVSARKYRRA